MPRRPEPLDVTVLESALDLPFEQWAHQCHGVSLGIVQSGLIPGPCRVARGSCDGVPAQHSWIVVGVDCYAQPTEIIDPTLGSYRDDVDGIWYGTNRTYNHTPHGAGNIWAAGRPPQPTGPVLELAETLSRPATEFLKIAAPDGLDRNGWAVLAHLPVGGWPAAEIIDAMASTPPLAPLIPVDVLGMLTDRNPGGNYLP